MNNKEESKEQIEAMEKMDTIEMNEKIDEKAVVSEEVCLENEEVIQENKAKDIKKGNFGARLLASLLDQVFCCGTSIIILFIISSIIRIFGYRFVLLGTYNMFILIYVIVNILYIPIMNSLKFQNTLGKKLLKL